MIKQVSIQVDRIFNRFWIIRFIDSIVLLSIVLVPLTTCFAEASLPLSKSQALAHLKKLEVDRKSGLDRLLAISPQISKIEFINALSQLRPARISSFTKSHLNDPNVKVRRATYFALALMPSIDPRSWLSKHLLQINLNQDNHQRVEEKIAICESLAYSLHPASALILMDVYASEQGKDINLLDTCLTTAIYWVSLKQRVKISLKQAEDLITLASYPKSETGFELRALHLIALLAQSPQLILSDEQSSIHGLFKNHLVLKLKASPSLEQLSYLVLGLNEQESLGTISEWWGVSSLNPNQNQTLDLNLRQINHRKKQLSAQLMGSESAYPLTPIILQRFVDRLDHTKTVHLKSFVFDRQQLKSYLNLINTLLSRRKLPKSIGQEAKRGIRVLKRTKSDLEMLYKVHPKHEQSETNTHFEFDWLLYEHLICYLSALSDHSQRRISRLNTCSSNPNLRPLIVRLGIQMIAHWGAHRKTKALKKLFALFQPTKPAQNIKVNYDWGLEWLAQALTQISPIGRRRDWMIEQIKDLLPKRSLVAQATLEVITEHRLKLLLPQVLERIKQALAYDEYAVVVLGLKTLEAINPKALKDVLFPLQTHHHSEISTLAYILASRYGEPEPNPQTVSTKPFSLEEQISLVWLQKSKLRELEIKLSSGTIKLRVSPHAFTSIKTLDLFVKNGLFASGVITSASRERVIFSPQVKASWATWLYPPRSEITSHVNTRYLHDTWVLTWDPLTFDHMNSGWIFSRSSTAIGLLKHGIIAEVVSGQEYLESALIGDQIESLQVLEQSIQ